MVLRRSEPRSGRSEERFSPVQENRSEPSDSPALAGLPLLLTMGEVASILRTTRTAVYAMGSRGRLPGSTRLGRRVLCRSDDLLRWLDQNRAPSPKE